MHRVQTASTEKQRDWGSVAAQINPPNSAAPMPPFLLLIHFRTRFSRRRKRHLIHLALPLFAAAPRRQCLPRGPRGCREPITSLADSQAAPFKKCVCEIRVTKCGRPVWFGFHGRAAAVLFFPSDTRHVVSASSIGFCFHTPLTSAQRPLVLAGCCEMDASAFLLRRNSPRCESISLKASASVRVTPSNVVV